jgi:aryl-alcohol dehydrogenase-like predicted oxidoreductase
MEQRYLGNTGQTVSAIGLGCAGMSEGYGATEDLQSLQTLSIALEKGVNFFDTADVYGNGHNEQLLGKFLQDRRGRAFVATKFGLVRKPGAPPLIDNSPSAVRPACDASLQRLKTNTIDLLYLQRRDPEVPIEEVVGAMADLVQAGKVRYLGLSEVSPETLRRANAVHPIAAVQSEYSLCTRGPEVKMLRTCRELKVSFVAYCPLGRGLLTGAVKNSTTFEQNDFRQRLPRFQGEALARNLELLKPLEALAAEHEATRAQIALAWLLNKYPHVIPIPGSKKSRHATENAAAAAIKLTQHEIEKLDALFSQTAITGDRYPPPAMAGIEQC